MSRPATSARACTAIHFAIELHLSGDVDGRLGWVMDFADVREAFQPIYDQLDHHYLNEIAGLENPTSENLARWVWHTRSRSCLCSARSSSMKLARAAASTAGVAREKRLGDFSPMNSAAKATPFASG